MIIARFFGGLGNQLFIYYSAKSLARKNNCKLIIDHKTGYVKDNFNRKFLLNELIDLDLNDYLSESKMYLGLSGKIKKNLKKIYNYYLPMERKNYFKDNNKFYKNFQNLKNIIYLDSYMQYFSYFQDIKSIINDDFEKKLSSINNSFVKSNNFKNEVAICFRSFKEIKKRNKISWEYYKKCIQSLQAKLGNLYFHVYTDNKDFVLENYPEIKNYNIIMNDKVGNPVKTILLLAQFKNIIISESTFHWWAAYFNDEKKLIYAPSRHNNEIHYPKNWFIVK